MEKEIIVGIVHYCTPEYLKRAYSSIRQFYPDIKVIIVDGSPIDHPVREYLNEIDGGNTQVIFCNQNIGHAKGMNIIMEQAPRDSKVVMMDSDAAIIREGVIEAMRDMLGRSKYAIGQLIHVDENGNTVKDSLQIPYVHPYFCMINKDAYDNHSEFKHHGAPFLNVMKELPRGSLVNFPVQVFVEHRWRGTRDLNPKEFMKNWET